MRHHLVLTPPIAGIASLLLALLAAPCAPPAGAEPAGFEPRAIRDRALPCDARLPVPALDGPATLVAGERRWIRWRAPGSEVEELELLLSLDDGRRFVLRVSPELPGAEDRYEWRVPNLPAARARLRLRLRIDGREIESEAGAPFAIEADLGLPIEREPVHEGTWWTVPRGTSGSLRHAIAGPAPGPCLDETHDAAPCDTPVRAPFAAAPAAHPLPASAVRTDAAPASPPPGPFQPPRRTPLRA